VILMSRGPVMRAPGLLNAGRAIATGLPSEVLTSERLSPVYRQPIEAVPHPHRPCPLVLTIDPEDGSR
jgi:ABC-type hemin transport system ATPase subunit